MSQGHKQPKGFTTFFLTEMWERYGFYTLQGLLIFYLEKIFHFGDATSGNMLGSFSALAYILPVVGGYLADRFLGYRQAVVAGGLLMSLGFFLLALLPFKFIFFYFVSMIAMGTGLLKPNVSSLLGRLYKRNDKRRDAGYTLFYVGISSGIILASVFSGEIEQHFGWSASFFVAGVGLLIGAATFYYGVKRIKSPLKNPKAKGLSSALIAYGISILCILASGQIIQNLLLAEILFATITVVGGGALLWMSVKHEPGSLKRILGYLVMLCVSIIFWALFFQQFSSANLFISREVQHHIFGFDVPVSMFYGVEALAVILLGPIFSRVWYTLEHTNHPPSDAFKFALGMFFITIGFLILWLSVKLHYSGLVSPLWIIAAYVFVGCGDLALSPIGLSMVTKLAVPKLVGLMMGMWLLSIGVGSKLSGMLSGIAAVPHNVTSHAATDAIYRHAFFTYFEISVAATLLAFLLIPVFKQLTR